MRKDVQQKCIIDSPASIACIPWADPSHISSRPSSNSCPAMTGRDAMEAMSLVQYEARLKCSGQGHPNRFEPRPNYCGLCAESM